MKPGDALKCPSKYLPYLRIIGAKVRRDIDVKMIS
jgi:hypothetical protein